MRRRRADGPATDLPAAHRLRGGDRARSQNATAKSRFTTRYPRADIGASSGWAYATPGRSSTPSTKTLKRSPTSAVVWSRRAASRDTKEGVDTKRWSKLGTHGEPVDDEKARVASAREGPSATGSRTRADSRRPRDPLRASCRAGRAEPSRPGCKTPGLKGRLAGPERHLTPPTAQA